jgi:type II secretion system protein G
MKTARHLKRRDAFTLIELLIVVAIIAILAAIAVPNFLEAQTRSKVSRTLADMRSIRTALESYQVDNNRYPETDQQLSAVAAGRRSVLRLTTPVAYITSIPASPWKELYGSTNVTDPKIATALNSYLYVRRWLNDPSAVDPNYARDRQAYITQANTLNDPRHAQGEWSLKSVGPDNIDDRDASNPRNSGHTARLYDPTNGTVSRGDIAVFNDVGGSLK